jgi:hypothetical protein
MLTRLLILGSLSILTACAEPTVETRIVVPTISADLRTPVPVPARRVTTLRASTALNGELIDALTTANARITTIDTILTQAEARAEGRPR